MKEKADAGHVQKILDRVDVAFANQREDTRQIFEEIKAIAETHNAFAQECIRELGKRPTRDECSRFWNHQ